MEKVESLTVMAGLLGGGGLAAMVWKFALSCSISLPIVFTPWSPMSRYKIYINIHIYIYGIFM